MAGDIDLLIFDLDGTLVDSRADLAGSANFMRKKFHLPPLSIDQVSPHIGGGVVHLVAGCLGRDEKDPEVPKALEIFKEHYEKHCADESRLYPGVRETLQEFKNKGKKLCVASNKITELSEKILAKLGVLELFDVVAGGDGNLKRKPDPETLEVSFEKLGIPASRAAMIGDSRLDVLAGRNAGVAMVVGVTYGIGDLDELKESGPDRLVGRFGDLKKLFLSVP